MKILLLTLTIIFSMTNVTLAHTGGTYGCDESPKPYLCKA